ncbi:hypothetical protein [Oceanibaculum indicum]|uniref:Uncharacterized protein n=1 Tax=Oceanibaculum indicum P24 TaxID=1207063 RepID=K2K020_9PROT|nr:hypothetical protein [Oceanibaculum indicum]EKE70870.1 hypothetical protein P24_15044 [Oceanibaculum indicum P24]
MDANKPETITVKIRTPIHLLATGPQTACDIWNRHYPVGTPVTATKDKGEKVETVTRSAAEVMGGHTAVIWLEGISGAYLLSRVIGRQQAEEMFANKQFATLEGLKRAAVKLKRAEGISHSAALEEIARDAGFANYSDALQAYKKGQS